MTDVRCDWAAGDLLLPYHDKEWGVPHHDDRGLFELLVLETAQAGLSWITVLKKREHYRAAFDGFDPRKIAGYDRKKRAALLRGPSGRVSLFGCQGAAVRRIVPTWVSRRVRARRFVNGQVGATAIRFRSRNAQHDPDP